MLCARPVHTAQVVVRVRPVLAQEASSEVGVSCSEDGSSVQVQLGDRSNSNKEQLPGARKSAAKSYTFDACLPGRTTQVRTPRESGGMSASKPRRLRVWARCLVCTLDDGGSTTTTTRAGGCRRGVRAL